MTGIMDPVTLIFLVIALVVFMRLFSALGKHTDNKPPGYDSFNRQSHRAERGDSGNVISLPGAQGAEEDAAKMKRLEDDLREMTGGRNKVVKVLKDIGAATPAFEAGRFIAGAKMAYEMIVTGFAQGDRDTLKPLLSDDVYKGFDEAISAREENEQEMSFQFIGIRSAMIEDATLADKIAQIAVHFSSEVVSALRDRSGRIIDGNETQVTRVEDIWTFERNVTARNPNWKLVATRSAA